MDGVENVRFAKMTGHFTSPKGHTVLVIMGSHWPADDPLVKAYPDAFSDDYHYGLVFSQPPVADQVAETVTPRRLPGQVKVETATKEPGEVKDVRR